MRPEWRQRGAALMLAVCLSTALAATPTQGSGPSAGQRAASRPIDQTEALIQRLENIQSLQARFEQVTLDARQQRVQQTQGSLQVAAPGRFRLETEQPVGQVLVSDGESFWTFDAELEQVVISDLAEDVSQVPILLLGGNVALIRDKYLVVGFTSEPASTVSDAQLRDVFVLSPKASGSLFESLTLEFVDDLPREILLRDSLGQQSRIVLSEVSLNPALNNAAFTFEAPAGVDIVDNRTPMAADEPVR